MNAQPTPHGTAPARLHQRLGTGLLASATALLSACASPPAPPDWQANAFAALKEFSAADLSGNTRLADAAMARTRAELSRTGRADLLARAELTRCATHVASLDFDGCPGYLPLAADAGPPAQAYAAFLNGQWRTLNAELLPAHHRALVLNLASQPKAAPAQGWIAAIDDPLARLVAAGVLLQNKQLTPADIELATETASSQGWRKPLLAWLGVQQQQARDTGNTEASARLQRRIARVLQGAPAR
jgi:hypothetical protein